MASVWRRALSALTGPELQAPYQREQTLARAAADLALTEATSSAPATAADVQRIARDEFGVGLTISAAAAALAEQQQPDGFTTAEPPQ